MHPRIRSLIFALIAAALLAVPMQSAAADDLAPVRRVACPSVDEVRRFEPTVTIRTATVTQCRYFDSAATPIPKVAFTIDQGAATPEQAKANFIARIEATGYPIYLLGIAPLPALGSGAWMWADQTPITAIWQLSPGVVGNVQGTIRQTPTSIVALAKLFRPMMEVYTIEGTRTVNGRQWRTSCEGYSATARCRTEIWATVISRTPAGSFQRTDGWAFNSLTYRWSERSLWSSNPLAAYGRVGGTTTWTSIEGRQWRTECDTASTGRGACRSYLYATVYSAVNGGFETRNTWVFNNQVLFNR